MKKEEKDEEFLLNRARRKDFDSEQTNVESTAKSKAWLLTSKLILPNNFNVRYEAYHIAKERRRVQDAAKTFQNLFQDFKVDKIQVKLWQEIDLILEVLAAERDQEPFLIQMFHALPLEIQKDVLLSASNYSTDSLEKLKRLLLTFKKFPDLISSMGENDPNGLPVMVELCKAKLALNQSPRAKLDENLALFVTEIAPLMIPVSRLTIHHQLLHEILMLTFEFIFISLLTTKDPNIPWSNLTCLFGEIGLRLGWPIAHNMNKGKDLGLSLYHNLLTLHRSQTKPSELTQDQIFFIGSLVFFKSLSEYRKLALGGSSGSNGAILVEAFVTHKEELEPLAKRRRRTEDELKIPNITHGEFGPNSPLVEAFTDAVNYYDLLASDPAVLNRLQTQLHPPESVIYPFFVDIAISQGRFKEALQTMRHLQASSGNTSSVAQCRFHLKAASLCYATGDNQSMTDQVWQTLAILANCHKSIDEASETSIVDSKNLKATRTGHFLTIPSSKYRHIHFLDFNRQAIISYAVKILYLGLKEKAVHPIAKNDMAIGHILTLLQYSHPEEQDVMQLIIDRLKRADNFTYPMFMHHIVHIDFLEMFSNIMMESNVTLDIAATYTGAPAASSTPGSRLVRLRVMSRVRKNILIFLKYLPFFGQIKYSLNIWPFSSIYPSFLTAPI